MSVLVKAITMKQKPPYVVYPEHFTLPPLVISWITSAIELKKSVILETFWIILSIGTDWQIDKQKKFLELVYQMYANNK